MGYRVKKEFLRFEALTTLVDGVRVSLIKEYTHTTEATATNPPKTIHVPLASQAQMKAIFERGDPCVEQYEDETPKPFNKKEGEEKDVKNERK